MVSRSVDAVYVCCHEVGLILKQALHPVAEVEFCEAQLQVQVQSGLEDISDNLEYELPHPNR